MYYKPLGLVSSDRDEKGRQTIYDTMPEGMPRVMSVGRLDLNSEGLLLLTNDGELKRRLELPETGWLRKYRVRVNGRPNDLTLDPLRRGITIEGEDFMPMDISLDRQQGANAWLTVGLREGKNREVRRAMTEVGLTVNRLIRVSYGPFRLNEMEPGAVVEVKARVMREQLGGLLDGLIPQKSAKAEGGKADDRARPDRSKKPRAGEGADAAPKRSGGFGAAGGKPGGARPERTSDRKGDRPDAARGDRPFVKRKPTSSGEDRAERPARSFGAAKPAGSPRGDRPAGGARAAKPAYGARSDHATDGARAGKPPYGDRSAKPAHGAKGGKPGYGDKSARPAYGARADRPADAARTGKPAYGDRAGKSQTGERPGKPAYKNRGAGKADAADRPKRTYPANDGASPDRRGPPGKPAAPRGDGDAKTRFRPKADGQRPDRAAKPPRPGGAGGGAQKGAGPKGAGPRRDRPAGAGPRKGPRPKP